MIQSVTFTPIDAAIAAIRRGEILIVVDDEDRENEGDFVMAADRVSPERVNFMACHGRGLICAPIAAERAQFLGLDLMVTDNTALHETAFTVSVDAKRGTTTGISAADRATTIRALVDPATRPADLARPGHIFPLRAKTGGVLRRAGHTEAAVDLARLAGFAPVAVLCEVIDDDGTMARLPRLIEIARRHEIGIITIEDLIQYRRLKEKLVVRLAETRLPTAYGDFRLILYGTTINDEHHVALVKGEVTGKENVLTRVHSSCFTGDVLASLRCDCGPQLGQALRQVEAEGEGVVLYMHQEGRGIGLVNKLKAYMLQDAGLDTVEANEHLGFRPDPRDYGIGCQILVDLGLTTLRLLTNNPQKRAAIEGYGLQITEHVSIEVEPTTHNRRYLDTKRDKLGHLLRH
ncbi:MAG TPA: bifunctional 3,4-dihydroxy-2-butanone-4-phosphate synthase/GTP cyclohydrolase II [Gemmatimonadota bacterium]|nr:bifunctional 3,4-dihydroxy-2-butanone-4-phosphate synthase/GTP cyclohydrolase II [Gemmatimonadota bacterium]